MTNAPVKSETPTPIRADNGNNYRRQRRRRQDIARRKKRTALEELVWTARVWAPYGPVPPDEIFIQFGLDPDQFSERLWSAVTLVECAPSLLDALSAIYWEAN